MRLAVGLPCPGCGATRALLLLCRGELRASLRMHPVIAPGLLVVVAAAVLTLVAPPSDAAWDRGARRALAVFGLALMGAWCLRLVGLLAPV